MTTTMNTRTSTRAASAATLTLSAMLALSACGGGDDTAAKDTPQAEGVGDNAGPQGVYIGATGNTESSLVVIHGDEVVETGIDINGTCEDFTTLFNNVKAGDFADDDIVGTLNDSQSLILWPSDTGNDPTPITVNTPDTGMITVGSDGDDYFTPLSSDQGTESFDQWKKTLCG